MAERRPRVLLLGLPYFCKDIAAALESRGWEARFLAHPGRSVAGWARVARELVRADVLYLVSARVERGSPLDRLLKVSRRPAVVHWVGTDVLIAREEWAAGRLSERVREGVSHWADAPWLVAELAEMGFRAEMVRLPVKGLSTTLAPLPEEFTVLLYLPVDAFDREVFDVDTILALPSQLPDVRFVLIPSPPETLPGGLPPNLEARAWVEDMDALYAEVTVLARLVSHDGMPFMVLEGLSRGRHVIFPYDLPGVTRASGPGEVTAVLRSLRTRHQQGTLELNEEGAEWVRQDYGGDDVTADLDRRLRALLPG